MNGWAAITEANLTLHISGAELESLRAAALAAGQADPVAPSIAQVTDRVRGEVKACRTNVLSTDTTEIPTRLLPTACSLIVALIISRVPGYPLSKEREDAKKEAIRLLERVAACEYAIEDASTGAEAGSGSELVNSTTARMSRAKLDGI